MKANTLGYEIKYSDDSGVEFGVYYDSDKKEIEIKAVSAVFIPVDNLEWLMTALQKIDENIEEGS